jgi:DNA invertase Pin-like site-specific DNA recombinase
MKVAGYIRVSTEEQAAEGVSLDAQRAKLEAYATMRGLELVEIFVDAGVSAGKPLESRKGGADLLRALRRRKNAPKAVVALKLDRLFRNAGDCLATVEAWDRRGLALHLLDLGGSTLDTGSAMGRFFLTVMAGAAELERNLTRERTADALAHKKARGERVGQVPFGYQAAGADLVEHDDEQRTIAEIRSMRADGLSLRAIVDELNDSDFQPRGDRWHLTTVRRILAAAI